MENQAFDINSLPLSVSVRGVVGKLPATGPVSAWQIVAGILESHTQYGEGRAAMILKSGGPAAPGRAQTVSAWLEQLAALFDMDRLKPGAMDGRLTIWALAQLDPDLGGYLKQADFLKILEKEYTADHRIPPVKLLRRRQPGFVVNPTATKGQSPAQSAVPPSPPPFDETAELEKVRMIAEPEERVKHYADLLPRLSVSGLVMAGFEIGKTLNLIKDPSAKIAALVTLLPHAPLDLQREWRNTALKIAGMISEPPGRVDALLQLLPHLEPEARPKIAREALQDLKGIEDPSFRSASAGRLLSYLPEEDRKIWLADFPGPIDDVVNAVSRTPDEPAPAPAFSPPVGTVFSDRPNEDQRDLLDIQREVRNIANVLVYKAVEPPLALGLFGDWGSGKTFFMGKLRKYVRQIASHWQEQEALGNQSSWCTRVAQIDFNAWHFSDANLWASLVTHIYEELDRELNTQKIVSKKLQKQILEARVEAARDTAVEARLRLGAAKEQVGKAEQSLQAMTRERQEKEDRLQNAIGRLPELLSGTETYTQLQYAASALGMPQAAQTYDALKDLNAQLGTLRGRTTAVSAGLLRSPWTLVLSAFFLLLAPFAFTYLIEHFGAGLESVGRRVAEVGGFLLSIILWLQAQVRHGLRLVDNVGAALQKADELRQQKIESDPAVLQARQALQQAQTEEQAAQSDLQAAQAELQNLQQELQELRPERRLLRLIESRASAGDYSRQLGIISMIRTDFEQMSGLLERMVSDRPEMLRKLPELKRQRNKKRAARKRLDDQRAGLARQRDSLQAACEKLAGEHTTLLRYYPRARDIAELTESLAQKELELREKTPAGSVTEPPDPGQAAERAELKRLQDAQQRLVKFFPGARRIVENTQSLGAARKALADSESTLAAKAAELAGCEKELAALEEQVQESEDQQKQPPIQRIILYIDDLDRCKPERVVEVLEAVHLLLYFRLFVVVVAVDPRWLRHSLHEHYPATLSEKQDGRQADGPREMAPFSTPQDYLEKIFQVPFALRPVGKQGYENLVKDLLQPLPEEPPWQRPSPKREVRTPSDGGDGKTPLPEKREQPEPPDAGAGAPRPTDGAQSTPGLDEETYTPIPARQLQFKPWEEQDIPQLWRMFRAPRTVKRFVNIYRLLRAGLAEEEVGAFEGTAEKPGEYRVALLLLAAMTGFPNEAERFLGRLDAWLDERERLQQRRDTPESPDREYTWPEVVKYLRKPVHPPAGAKAPLTAEPPGEGAEEWESLLSSLERVAQESGWGQRFTVQALRSWSSRTARFSFCVQPASVPPLPVPARRHARIDADGHKEPTASTASTAQQGA